MSIYTKSADIAAHISTLLTGIRTTNGYSTDIGVRVMRGKRKVDDSQVPCAVLIEGEDTPGETSGYASQKITQAYALGGYVQCDPDNPNDAAHLVVRDIKRAIFSPPAAGDRPMVAPGLRLGGRVLKVRYAGRDIGPRADGMPIVFAVVHIEVDFVEQLDDA